MKKKKQNKKKYNDDYLTRNLTNPKKDTFCTMYD